MYPYAVMFHESSDLGSNIVLLGARMIRGLRHCGQTGLPLVCLVALVGSCLPAAEYAPPARKQALQGVQSAIADAAKGAAKPQIWLSLFGSLQKCELVKADAKAISVKLQNNVFEQPWEKLSTEEIVNAAISCAQGDGQRAIVAADYCIAVEVQKKAEEALELAAKADPALKEKLAERWLYLKNNPAGVSAEQSTMRIAAAPDRASAPAKIAFKGSEPGSLASVKEIASAIDNVIDINLAEMGIKPEGQCDDAAFLRRASLDLTGQIPLPEEVIEFFREGGAGKRAKKIEELLERSNYADHWSTFWSVLLVGRRTRDDADVKTAVFKSWLRDEFSRNEPFDKIVTELLTASGTNQEVGPVNYLTYRLNDTLPEAMAHISQTFLGARIGCAQCHDHPFDKWTQQDFWGFSSFLANTRSERKELREDPKNPRRVTKSWHVLTDQEQRNGGGRYDPPQRELRLPPKALDGPVFAAAAKRDLGGELKKKEVKPKDGDKDKKARDTKGMPADMSGEGMMGSTVEGANGSRGQTYRQALAAWITDPKNEKFAQSAVNRVWRSMFGYGLVEPVDDIRPKNPPSHPEVMSILANDFNASGRDLKRLCRIIANTRAYQRSSLGDKTKADRQKAVRNTARAEVRPMTPEMLFSAVVKATGGEEKAKALTEGLLKREEAMMSGDMMNGRGQTGEFYNLLQRFINTSTAEDRAGKLQFEGTVSQALMLMHSGFIQRAIADGVTRFKQKGMGDMVYIFAATLGRPPTPIEASAFAQCSDGLQGIMWVLLNSAEFVTIH